jgi:hypothetical protein
MNCQDILRTLELRNVNTLSAAERQACEAHAASCPRCGPEWIAFSRLAAIPVPPMPDLLAGQCEALVAGLPTSGAKLGRGRRPRNRFLLIGALAALSAAAAMIEVVPRVVAESRSPQSGDAGADFVAPTGEASPVAAGSSVTTPAGRFTVHLRSLRYESPDAAALRKVQEYHAVLAEGLRAVPGLQLLDDEAVAWAGVPASYRITIESPDAATAERALANDVWSATFRAEVLRPASEAGSASYGTGYVSAEGLTRGGVGGPESFAGKSIVVPHSGQCGLLILCTPRSIAEWQIKDLRMQVFPLDGSIQQELEARFLDPSLPVGEHFQALNDLQAVTRRGGSSMSDAVVREALVRMDRTPRKEDRDLYLAFLGGQRHPVLIQPLIDMALRDPEHRARRAAVEHLAADFRGDTAVRAALESVSRNDRNGLNRKVAERVLVGEAPWNDYVVATMNDTAQTVQQRLEPLRWMMDRGIPVAPLADAVLGEDRQVIINLLVQAGKERHTFTTRALGAFGSLNHPGAPRFVLSVFDAIPDYERLRLLERHLADPDVRARVEQIAADPSDETLQVGARGMLDGSANK